ncbi:hypothetical protein PHMEG_00039477 [Phytophthora megakarya]|uniref:Uncharacterized protein n=1 Tax=Phytophthora megakarya TaxID=4795 RepID=A0A225UFJ9_9STRA|nr:hypothetical protein PHMEG_00039477 [Phytophthora megakarya]
MRFVGALFNARRADMDLLLDVMMLLFSPRRTALGRWDPGTQHATWADALADVDAREPWRRFFLSQPDANGDCTVTRGHPAFNVRRLAGKFIERGSN